MIITEDGLADWAALNFELVAGLEEEEDEQPTTEEVIEKEMLMKLQNGLTQVGGYTQNYLIGRLIRLGLHSKL